MNAGSGRPAERVLPSGTLTFVFTDLEGSTRVLETVGRERYADLVAAHGTLVEDAFDAHGGLRIDSQGDSAFFVFRSALDALLAAAAAQRSHARREWPEGADVSVRIGVHTGEATVAGDRYFGLAVHRAARICTAAHGGQVLTSATTRDVAEDALPPDLELRDLGEHRLKDIARPERLFQLAIEGLHADFSQPRGLEQQDDDAFEGREEELAAAAEAAVAPPASPSHELALRVADTERERAVAQLREHTVAGRLTLEEFSERLDEAYGARTRGDLEQVTRELPVPAAPTIRRRAARLTLSIFGHTVRRGLLQLTRLAFAVSIFGDLDLDLRSAVLEHDRATVVVFALLGNADVYVPEGIDVEVGGLALGGHARDWGRVEAREGSPQLRVRLVTLFGTADVFRVPPGARGTYGQLIKITQARQRELPPGDTGSG